MVLCGVQLKLEDLSAGRTLMEVKQLKVFLCDKLPVYMLLNGML